MSTSEPSKLIVIARMPHLLCGPSRLKKQLTQTIAIHMFS